MASNALSRPITSTAATGQHFAPVVAWSAIGGGIAALVYALAFVVLRNDALAAAMLALGGGLTLVVYTGLYDRLAPAGAGFARLALVFGLLGGAGALVHGGYDLANALHPPAAPNLDLPSAIDPRGLLTFGAGGVALLIVAPLLGRAGFPRGLGRLGALPRIGGRLDRARRAVSRRLDGR